MTTETSWIPEEGEFISIPVWNVIGCVMEVYQHQGTKEIQVLLQEHPDQPAKRWITYRLQQGEFEIQ